MASVETAVRQFKYGEIVLPDPGPDMDEKAVLAFYADEYPELTTASCSAPVISVGKDNQSIATFNISQRTGTKG